ncbi:unnamed protein product [Knipowitschia caucasica]|uniref:Secretogranin II n=1 Tax=Knipowitschia caucasica TaxID=637954 RepID=A0AAV2J858_KNICA
MSAEPEPPRGALTKLRTRPQDVTMPPSSSMSKSSPLCPSYLVFLLLFFAFPPGLEASTLRDHRLRGAESNVPSPNEDMLKALEYIQSLRQNVQPQDDHRERERATSNQESPQQRLEDKSEELLQAVLSTLQHTEPNPKPKAQEAIAPHREMPLLFEDDEKEDAEEAAEDSDRTDDFKRTNENVEEKYTPQNLATLQSVFDELGKINFNFNTKRENSAEDESFFNARDAAYDERDWEEDQDERHDFERALDYLEDGDQENGDSLVAKRSTDDNEGKMANLADFYLLKVLEQTEEEEQKKREIEEEEEGQERKERSTAVLRNNIDPKTIYRLLQVSQKYQIPPEDLIDMLRSGEIARMKVNTPVHAKKTYKKPEYLSRRLPLRQKTPDEMRTERILKILGLSGDENRMQSPFRKQYKTIYSRPVWRDASIKQQLQQKQRFPTKQKDDYDDTENELATFLAARMLSKYPTHKSRVTQKREETTDDQAGSFERAVQDYFDQLDSDRNAKSQSDVEKREVEDFDNEEVMKLLSFVVTPDERDAKITE